MGGFKMRVLAVVAHPDDEILGCGGTLLKHKEAGDEVFICMVTKAYQPEWTADYIQNKLKEAKEVDKILGVTERIYCNLPTVKLNTIPYGKLNREIIQVVDDVDPDVIYTHFEHDVNKDHNIIFNAVMVATRPIKKKIKVVCFETISSTEWSNKGFTPNLYVDITSFIDKKIEAFSKYESEVKDYPHPRSKEGIRIWSNKRGIEVCIEYAEAFMVVRDFW
jgi:LmbE family N-acetylglucosaminyl deacetylase